MTTKLSVRGISAQLSRKEKTQQIGHSEDRLYKDRRFQHKFEHQSGTSICLGCGAICHEKHWFIEPAAFNKLMKDAQVNQTMCPGCHRVEQKMHDGEVILENSFLLTDKESIMGLIKHTEGKAWHDNPTSRIASIVDDGDRMEIKTTTKWLATRIGKELEKCYRGKLEIKPSPKEKFVRVYWK